MHDIPRKGYTRFIGILVVLHGFGRTGTAYGLHDESNDILQRNQFTTSTLGWRSLRGRIRTAEQKTIVSGKQLGRKCLGDSGFEHAHHPGVSLLNWVPRMNIIEPRITKLAAMSGVGDIMVVVILNATIVCIGMTEWISKGVLHEIWIQSVRILAGP